VSTMPTAESTTALPSCRSDNVSEDDVASNACTPPASMRRRFSQRRPADQAEKFPLRAPFNRPSVGFDGPEPLAEASTPSFALTVALRRRNTRVPTATTATMPPITTAGQKIVWNNQIRRWTFATRIDARRNRATLSISAFRACSLGAASAWPEVNVPGRPL
jgi:hypothetical protein